MAKEKDANASVATQRKSSKNQSSSNKSSSRTKNGLAKTASTDILSKGKSSFGSENGKRSEKKKKEMDDLSPEPKTLGADEDEKPKDEPGLCARLLCCCQRGNGKDDDKDTDGTDGGPQQTRKQKQDEREINTPEQSLRAQQQWAKLRKHILDMKTKANHLVVALAEANEKKLETKYGEESGINQGGKYGEKSGTGVVNQRPTGCIQNIIIDPSQSSWLPAWHFVTTIVYFSGFLNDPWHIAFILSSKISTDTTNMDRTANMQIFLVADAILLIDIIFKSLTAYQVDDQMIYDVGKILWNYFRGTMIFDCAATIPGFFLDGGTNWFYLKLFRVVHVRRVFGQITSYNKAVLTRCNMDKAGVEKTSYIMDLILVSFTVMHVLGCTWIYVGTVVKCSWLDQADPACGSKGMVVNRKSDVDVYITSFYWVITTLTTVGYGDYKGYTPNEYMFQMLVEFLGIGIFSYLMGSINSLAGSESTLQDILDERVETIEGWLRKLEKAREKSFSKQLYDSIKEFTRQAYYYDYCQVSQSEFFQQLKPRIRHRLVNSLFQSFSLNFFYLFNDSDFEAGVEFTSVFLSGLYASMYLPENEIVRCGDMFDDLFMIQEGIVSLHLSKVDDNDPTAEYEFFVLPTFSYFGDYQVLFGLQSQISFKAGENRVLICLCLRKEKLLELMDDFPEAKKFYYDRAWERRTEFRRLQKRFYAKIEEIQMDRIRHAASEPSLKTEDSSDISDNSDAQEVDAGGNVSAKIRNLVCQEIDQKISKFYFFNEESMGELKEEDFDLERLEAISDDEKPEDLSDLQEDDKFESYRLARKINMQMGMMIESFGQLTETVDYNFQHVNRYIKDLQKSKADKTVGASKRAHGADVKKPRLKSLMGSIADIVSRADNYELMLAEKKQNQQRLANNESTMPEKNE